MKEYSIDMGKFKQCGDNSQTISFLPMIHLWQTTKARRSQRISGFSPTNSQFCDTESCRRGGKLWTRSMQAAVRSSHMRRWDIWYIYYHIWGGEIYDICIYDHIWGDTIYKQLLVVDTHTGCHVWHTRKGGQGGCWPPVVVACVSFNISGCW